MRLDIFYDAGCFLCQGCRQWMEQQPAFVELQFIPCQSEEARRRFGDSVKLGQELLVMTDEGAVYTGPSAFIMCLWALRKWRSWAYRLSTPKMAPLAGRFFVGLSSGRKWLMKLIPPSCTDEACTAGPYR